MKGAAISPDQRRLRWAIAVAVLLGLGLRLAMGRGGLWLDEAWSVVMAHDAGNPVAVITGIHHDNNHPLNSWWLQLVGPAAPPLLMRTLSIVCSTVTICVAARFAARRSALAGVTTAYFFAIAPMLVLLGSEARGYAPMILALVWIIDRLDSASPDQERARQAPLVIAALIGTLSHFAMFPALILLCGWQFAIAPGGYSDKADRVAARMARPCLASLMVIVAVIGMAYKVQGGLTIGSITPFSWSGLAAGLADSVDMTFGLGPWPLLLVPMLLLFRPHASRNDAMLWIALGLGFPVAAALLHPANSHIARYFVPSTIALLLLIGTRVGTIRRSRLIALLTGLMLFISAMIADSHLISSHRGEPTLPVRLIAAERPDGARLLLSTDRLSAPIRVASWQSGARLTIIGADCAGADYLLTDGEMVEPPMTIDHCGQRWTRVDFRPAPYRGAIGWALYRPAGLQG